MLTDPQSVTISATAVSLPRIEERAATHVYSNRDAGVELFVTQKVDNKNTLRSSASLVKSVIITDPVTGIKSKVPYSVTISDTLPLGVTVADVEALYDALTAALGASTKALLRKIFGGEK